MNESLLISFFTLMSYFIYEFAHYYAHAWEAKSGYLKFIQQNHFHHHLNPKVNFGQTSPLWDFVFGTYEKANLKANQSKREFLYIEEKWILVPYLYISYIYGEFSFYLVVDFIFSIKIFSQIGSKIKNFQKGSGEE